MIILRKEHDNKELNNHFEIDKISSLYAAVDIGTTNVVIDLYSACGKYEGERITRLSERNTQTILGKDVIMRIMHCENGKLSILHGMIINQIEEMITEYLSEISKDSLDRFKVHKIVVTGNTVMCHIFLNENPKGLKGAPFKTAYEGSRKTVGESLGFKYLSEASIYVYPAISAFVGADAATCLIASGIYKDNKISILADIGTNAEIILNANGKLYATSVAAGPAFEGNILECGMSVKSGAITRVSMMPYLDNIIISVKDDNPAQEILISPLGISASGYVDLLSSLLKLKIITQDGYLIGKNEALELYVKSEYANRIMDVGNKRRFYLCMSGEDYSIYGTRVSDLSDATYAKLKSIYISQEDIRELQLAKAAVLAGIMSLLEKAHISPESVDNLYFAGMLGNNLDINSIRTINMIPKEFKGNIKGIGNAALNGAYKGLFSEEYIKLSEEIVRQVSHLQLADDGYFKKAYMDSFEMGNEF